MQLVSKTYWAGAPFNFRSPPDAEPKSLVLRAADFRQHRALLWVPRGTTPKLGVVCIHPRVDFTHHYSFPRLVAAGVACLGANTRHPNNDTDTVHEEIVHDVGSCVRYLKEKLGVERVVLLGNSGGGSLSAFYQAQAELPASERIALGPDGAKTHLPDVAMPSADGLILISAHRGQGQVLLQCIDPSVTDESDPLSVDPSLDMYDEANRFRPAPAWSEYDAQFVARFRAAQLARVKRLDQRARELIDKSRRAAERLAGVQDPAERVQLERASVAESVMVIYRTMANPNYVDRRLDPSPREYGSLISERPDLMNFRYLGFARSVTPRAWLSTWSGLSSNADLCRNLAGVSVPTLVVNAGRDKEIYPETDAAPIFAAAAAADKHYLTFERARHYFEPDFGARDAPDVERLMDAVLEWIRERFTL